MDKLSYKTISANKNSVVKEWILIDAEDQVLGRLASRVAMILRGKHKPSYTPHVDCGDNVIIINAEKVKVTGQKVDQKEYVRHSGYPGSQRFRTVREMMVKDPTFVLNHAIKGMLPKNALGRELLRNVRIYVGPEHKHEAQEPKTIDLNTIK
ncbi:MAG: 50S ribosomal protein L13 [Bacteroidales bacterium]|jgi:large subunit ribosomal protein L13|nr:50S ribosomal protein L13 [Bacteroidales bacterium]